MLSPLTTFPSGSLDALDWQAATFLASGCSGVVFEVAPGIVAKVSPCIEPSEAAIQARLAREGLALPIIVYAQEVWLPEALRRAACSPHGLRRWHEDRCTCDAPVDVLLMPRIERTCRWEELQAEPVKHLIQRIEQVCQHVAHRSWDCHAGNIGVYQGRYVALDFGGLSDTSQS